MTLWGVERLEAFRADCLRKIERLSAPSLEGAFRSWAMAVTAPVSCGERVQGEPDF